MGMKYRFSDLVDLDRFRSMLKSFYEATGILHGLVDSENQVISAIGWQEACTRFHRVHPRTNERCLESNRYLAEHLGDGAFVGYACGNGLMDYATPIVVEGQQLATLYFGQLFHEPPDMEFFRRQARECGFDEEEYLAVIRKVPIIARERIEPIMAFYVQLAQMLARSGLDRMRALEAEHRLDDINRDLALRVEERTAELKAKNEMLAGEIRERQEAEDALQAVLDSSPIGISLSNRDRGVIYANRRFTELFGYTMNDIPTVDHWMRLAYPDESFRRMVVKNWEKQIEAARHAGEKPPVLESPVVCKNGGIRHVIVAMSWVGDRLLVNFSDISDRWLAEQRDRARRRVLEMIAKGAPLQRILEAIVLSVEAESSQMTCSILLLDRDGRHLRTGAAPHLPEFYNQAIDGLEIGDGVGSCGTAAFTGKQVIVADISTHPYWAGFEDLASRAGMKACWSEPILSSTGQVLGTFANYQRTQGTPDSEALQLVASAANLASIAIEHWWAVEELERQAHSDFLTGLSNRRHFMELAETELARSLRFEKALSVLMLDIDHFKAVNDTHGHKTGDIVLQSFARTLRHTLREIDIIERLGGEEFAAILPETDGESAGEAAERLRQAVAGKAVQTEASDPLQITVSIGIATRVGASDNVEALLKRADKALYAAKNSGRNRVAIA